MNLYFDMNCSQEVFEISTYFLALLNLLIFVVVIVQLIYYRNHFPIKERSPMLSFLNILGLYIYIGGYPFMVVKSQITKDNYIVESTQLNIITEAGCELFIISLFLKSARIVYAFKVKSTRFDWLFANQVLIAVIACVYVTINVLSFSKQLLNMTQEQYITMSFYMNSFFLTLSVILMQLITYSLCNLEEEYKMKIECLVMILLLIGLDETQFYFQVVSTQISIQYILEKRIVTCLGVILPEVFEMIIFYSYITITILRPVHSAQKYHIKQPPSFILDSFKHFIFEKYCVSVFFKFLQTIDEDPTVVGSHSKSTLNEVSSLTVSSARKSFLLKRLQESQGLSIDNKEHPFKRVMKEVLANDVLYLPGDNGSPQTKFLNPELLNEQNLHLNIFSFYIEIYQAQHENQMTLEFMIYCFEQYFLGRDLKLTFRPLDTQDQFFKGKSNSIIMDRTLQNNLSIIQQTTFVGVYKQRFLIMSLDEQQAFYDLLSEMIQVHDYSLLNLIIGEFYTMASEYLEFLYFDHFRYTNSYQFLKKILISNEESQLKLYKLGMTLYQQSNCRRENELIIQTNG